ncbi:MAG: hypothetical protein Q9208_003068 [Pyrenodesmia sp. 3 TL-2023]
MGAPEYAMHLGDRPSSLSPSPLSDRSSLYDIHDVSEPLSEHENAFLDHTTSLLDQEYDYQRQLISHYSEIRDHASHPGYPQEQKANANGTGRHIPPSWPHPHEDRRDNLLSPPRVYTGMDAVEKGYTHDAYAYHYHTSRRPLVDYITNHWRTSASSPPYSPTSPSAPSIVQMITAPKFRRFLLVIILIVLMPWSSWKWYGRSRWEEHRLLNDALDNKLRKGAAWYGLNLRPAFMDMIQFETLDVSELPQEYGKRRLIFIGDVHGCYEELQALLTETKYNNHTDHIVFTGDLISKGPASAQVVDFAVNNSASCVRGNHEDRVVLAHRDLNTHRASLPGPDEDEGDPGSRPPSPGDPELDRLDEESFSHGDYIDRKFAKSLTPEQASYLISCPLILDVGRLPGLGRTTVVHAGLVPGVDLQNQDPMGVMNMRTVDLKTHVPSRSHSGTPWFKLWNKHQSLVPSEDRSTVVYGHDARRGLQLNKYSKGLDTGCASGGKLTALVVSIESGNEADQQTVSVSCEDHGGKKGKGRGWDDLPFMEIQEDNHGGRGTGHF